MSQPGRCKTRTADGGFSRQTERDGTRSVAHIGFDEPRDKPLIASAHYAGEASNSGSLRR